MERSSIGTGVAELKDRFGPVFGSYLRQSSGHKVQGLRPLDFPEGTGAPRSGAQSGFLHAIGSVENPGGLVALKAAAHVRPAYRVVGDLCDPPILNVGEQRASACAVLIAGYGNPLDQVVFPKIVLAMERPRMRVSELYDKLSF